ncbi:MAG: glycosyltransferase family 87 protein [Candidatus Gottesmanbacteria bacterium]|nr:glycosyltransferase family 87 protein [Candidatus Gottesmanbacteria bacterium]
MSKRFIVVGLACFVFLYAVFSLYRIGTTFAPDFSVFYDSAQALFFHQNPYALTSTYTGLGYPPFTLLAFMPFTVLPYQTAQVLWIFISFLLFLASIYVSLLLIRKRVWFREWCFVFVFAFFAFPTKFTLGMGQINFAALTLLLVSLWAQQHKRHVLSGIALGVLLMIKPHFVLFIPVYSPAHGFFRQGFIL